ncbi:hypothetical protein A1O1_00119 [Capronia coronata CBS 617.96]|uniref:Uncharacterized protein n=1 Tax=Capronia coronata CBS 617.96 TaxID=1182541 RepID=W9Z0B1_9EURO|nr:uncharacterized protein A1O1_00119 [Capronia coronata CBS 617.96]EXJ95001.1 hypothetical protein A1O1_00119 [Capronia coronata CBS 617.96]
MADNNPPSAPRKATSSTPSSSSSAKYISSSGHVLETPPLTARISRLSDSIYNFLGLYIVSLFSLDPYTAAQNSQFNTRAKGPNTYQERPRWGANRSGTGGGGVGGIGRGGNTGTGTGSGAGGRRFGGIDDVRGPECGSCG